VYRATEPGGAARAFAFAASLSFDQPVHQRQHRAEMVARRADPVGAHQ
jgi:hypothetical protein